MGSLLERIFTFVRELKQVMKDVDWQSSCTTPKSHRRKLMRPFHSEDI